MRAQSDIIPASLRFLVAGAFCVVLLITDNGLRGGVASGWALRKSLFLGILAAVPIAVLYRPLARGDWVQRALAGLLLLIPVLELVSAFMIAADIW